MILRKTRICQSLAFTMLFFGLQTQLVLGKEQFTPQVIDKAKRAVVTIYGKASLQAYESGSAWTGTGFVVDTVKGLVLTNAHVAGGAAIGTYEVAFHNGARADAKLLYYDPWLDYAFMQVIDPKNIPEDVTVVKFSTKDPVMNQPIFVIGNNEGKSFSIHTGNVSSIYEINGLMPQHSINLSLNTKGGSSGSPILNEKGEAVALNYGGSATFGIGLHPSYIRYALRFIAQGTVPVRQQIGVIVGSYSLNEGARYRNFPRDKISTYVKKFPDSVSQAIVVDRVLKGSPADGKLMHGDIIWAINGKEIGPSLVNLDMAMNTCRDSSVRLTICRNGVWSDLVMSLYNIEAHKVQRMVSFAGALFFEMDDFLADITGLPAGTLTFATSQSSTTFTKVIHYGQSERMSFSLNLVALDERPITNLNQLVERIPQLLEKKYFTVDYINHLPETTFGSWYMLAHNLRKADVEYDDNAPEPKLFTFDREEMVWKGEPILKTKGLLIR